MVEKDLEGNEVPQVPVDVKGPVMRKVIDFMRIAHQSTDHDIQGFLSQNHASLIPLVVAGQDLEVAYLLDSCRRKIIELVRNKTETEIRANFDMK